MRLPAEDRTDAWLEMLDVAIGLDLRLPLLRLVCSAVNELIELKL